MGERAALIYKKAPGRLQRLLRNERWQRHYCDGTSCSQDPSCIQKPLEMLPTMASATQSTKVRIVRFDEVKGYEIATTHLPRTCTRPRGDTAKSTTTLPPTVSILITTQELFDVCATTRPRRLAHRMADLRPHRLADQHRLVGRVAAVAWLRIWLNAEMSSLAWPNAERRLGSLGREALVPILGAHAGARCMLRSTG